MGQISQNEILCFFISHTKADLGCFLNENFWSLRACKKAANELHNIFLSHIYFFCRNFHHFNVFVLKSEYKLFWRVDDLTDLFFGLEVSTKKKITNGSTLRVNKSINFLIHSRFVSTLIWCCPSFINSSTFCRYLTLIESRLNFDLSQPLRPHEQMFLNNILTWNKAKNQKNALFFF